MHSSVIFGYTWHMEVNILPMPRRAKCYAGKTSDHGHMKLQLKIFLNMV